MMLFLKSLLILIFFTFKITETSVRFTNLKCEDLDPTFATFTKCYLKLVKRGTVTLNIHVKLFKLPVTNSSINLALYKKFNGYRPFLYNDTLDLCEFLRRPKKSPFTYIFYQLLKESSNINHTCPYNHDIIVQDLVIQDEKFKYFPLPNGDYMFQLKVAAYNDWKAIANAYMNIDLGFD